MLPPECSLQALKNSLSVSELEMIYEELSLAATA